MALATRDRVKTYLNPQTFIGSKIQLKTGGAELVGTPGLLCTTVDRIGRAQAHLNPQT